MKKFFVKPLLAALLIAGGLQNAVAQDYLINSVKETKAQTVKNRLRLKM
jgi:uncharacterized membrane protein